MPLPWALACKLYRAEPLEIYWYIVMYIEGNIYWINNEGMEGYANIWATKSGFLILIATKHIYFRKKEVI